MLTSPTHDVTTFTKTFIVAPLLDITIIILIYNQMSRQRDVLLFVSSLIYIYIQLSNCILIV